MKAIVIRSLTSELNADYLDFFDNRAFTDENPNGPCYNDSAGYVDLALKKNSKCRLKGITQYTPLTCQW